MDDTNNSIAGLHERDEQIAHLNCPVAIYRQKYIAQYAPLYTHSWPQKHELNRTNLAALLQEFSPRMPNWLDLACGQAWHFAQFPGLAQMLGVDLSEAQLAIAKGQVPGASFVCADMSRINLPEMSFDLVTNFWGAYCYLGSQARIALTLRRMLNWIRPGGAMYIEVLLAKDLESFNRSRFSCRTGFSVAPRSADYTEWYYDDIGGRHIMTSPPLGFFLELLEPGFSQIEARHDSAFMVHLIARNRNYSAAH